ncbi:hypothetical protein THAOC_25755 [Thalassiosira oceanica]|uniref:Uncharacterized protein n=1 Tax=Thalassiosira oceanica TaxID=159749 RepID=K0RN86_THAOC|nr:hypothetical protein THAOC_25755 [Thalassiosira oceanica]|eukprot:EJK54600.1 hypothetical protein THAOC_25755 [Thalassiosira oceanica]
MSCLQTTALKLAPTVASKGATPSSSRAAQPAASSSTAAGSVKTAKWLPTKEARPTARFEGHQGGAYNDADALAMVQARVAKKDPVAVFNLGDRYFHGDRGLQKDMQRGVELWEEAAELGSIQALYNLGLAHEHGIGVQKDMAKAVELYKKAAMKGHVEARHNLGCCEGENGNLDREVRHYLISAKMGLEASVEMIRRMSKRGEATKAQYAEALKGYQDALKEMKSHDRDEANAVIKAVRWEKHIPCTSDATDTRDRYCKLRSMEDIDRDGPIPCRTFDLDSKLHGESDKATPRA